MSQLNLGENWGEKECKNYMVEIREYWRQLWETFFFAADWLEDETTDTKMSYEDS